MNLTRWKPKKQDLISDIFDWEHPFFGLSMLPNLKRFDSELAQAWYPAVDVTESKDAVSIKADLPGLRKEDIQLSVDGNILTIRGERKYENEEKKKDYHRIERSYGVFERRVDLGSRVDQSKIKAKYNNGVLEVALPKTEESQTKQITIEG